MATKVPMIPSFERGAVSNREEHHRLSSSRRNHEKKEDEITQTSTTEEEKGNLTEEEADICLVIRTTAQKTIERYARYKKKANKILAEAIRCYEDNEYEDRPNKDAIAWMRRYSYYQGRTNLMKRVQKHLEDLEQIFQHLAALVRNHDDKSDYQGSNIVNHHDDDDDDEDDRQTSSNNSSVYYENVLHQLAHLRRMMSKKRRSASDTASDTVLWQQLHHIVVDKRQQEQTFCG